MIFDLIQRGYSPKEVAYYSLIFIFAITISFGYHEFMHAWVASWLGDETPENMGRLTLNPLAHIDPMGTILIIMCGFGWGKPVVFNPSRLDRFKSQRLMNIMVSLGGVFGNFLIALISRIAFVVCYIFLADKVNPATQMVFDLLNALYTYSMMLMAFNLIPIPPLDGFHVLEELLPYKVRISNGYAKFIHYGPMVLLALILIGRASRIDIISVIITLIEMPFAFVINLISGGIGYLLLLIV